MQKALYLHNYKQNVQLYGTTKFYCLHREQYQKKLGS